MVSRAPHAYRPSGSRAWRESRERRRRDDSGTVTSFGHGHGSVTTRNWPAGSSAHPFSERRVHRLRLLEGGEMAAIGDDGELGADDANGDFLVEFRRRRHVAVAD